MIAFIYINLNDSLMFIKLENASNNEHPIIQFGFNEIFT